MSASTELERTPQRAARGPLVFLRGSGDLGSGVAVALARAGCRVVVIELPRPTALRLTVAFASAVIDGSVVVGGVTGVHAGSVEEVAAAFEAGRVPVWTAGEAALRERFAPEALVDARLRGLSDPNLRTTDAPAVIALGPGFEAGLHAHFVIETNRGPALGVVLERGQAAPHTGTPGDIDGETARRILRSPAAGVLRRVRAIGDTVEAGEVVATVEGLPVRAQLAGLVRGLLSDGLSVPLHKKVGDVDPRADRRLLSEPSDKAAAIGRGVLEALARAGLLPSPPPSTPLP